MPKKPARIGIVGVNAIVFAGYKYNVARCGIHAQVRHIKGFRIHFSVRGKDEGFPNVFTLTLPGFKIVSFRF